MSYTCPGCRSVHPSVAAAAACCECDYIECPLTELPDHALLGGGQGNYSFGTAFTGNWELVLNGTRPPEPVRVYPFPPLVGKAVFALWQDRYLQGKTDAQSAMRKALGLSE